MVEVVVVSVVMVMVMVMVQVVVGIGRGGGGRVFYRVNLSLLTHTPSVAKSGERRPPQREIDSSIPSRVKPMMFKIDTCRFLNWCLAFIR